MVTTKENKASQPIKKKCIYPGMFPALGEIKYQTVIS